MKKTKMKLTELLSGIEYSSLSDISKIDLDIKRLTSNSQDARGGDLFVAIRGSHFNGHDFLDEVASKGVEVAIVEERRLVKNDFIQIKVESSRRAISILAKNLYKDPSRDIKIIGITGTNGKTTVSYLLESIFANTGTKTGLIGTINYKVNEDIVEAKHTTPGSLILNRLLQKMVNESVPYCIMEVSSHSLDQGRVEGIRFGAAIFTNLSHEHLDYHKTLENYLETKLKLFKNLDRDAYAVINKDSPYFGDLVSQLNSDFVTYGMVKDSDVMVRDLSVGLGGCRCYISTPKGGFEVRSPLIGRYNVYNILAASAIALAEGLDLDIVKGGIEKLHAVPGRMEKIECGQEFGIFVDYAHTEDALRNVLNALRGVGNNKIISVFGCGGDRDKAKRPMMARVTAELADFTIITSDNPRSEDPKKIAKEIEEGFMGTSSGYTVILDRYEAIKRALTLADRDTIVLIAGKGHEREQIFKDRAVPFDDREVVREVLKGL